jgi:hypothetical protein
VSAERQLAGFLAKFTPAIAREARAAIAKMRERLPGAVEMVYDNYNALVIGFCPNDSPSEAIFSIAVLPNHVSLCFLQGGPELPDPAGLLQGSGRLARHIKLDGAAQLDEAEVRNLMGSAMARARVPFDPRLPGRLVIRSISAKQRPRRQ